TRLRMRALPRAHRALLALPPPRIHRPRPGGDAGPAHRLGGHRTQPRPRRQRALPPRKRLPAAQSSELRTTSSELVREETFGPPVPIIRVAGLDDAIAIANGTRYRLSAGGAANTPSPL